MLVNKISSEAEDVNTNPALNPKMGQGGTLYPPCTFWIISGLDFVKISMSVIDKT